MVNGRVKKKKGRPPGKKNKKLKLITNNNKIIHRRKIVNAQQATKRRYATIKRHIFLRMTNNFVLMVMLHALHPHKTNKIRISTRI